MSKPLRLALAQVNATVGDIAGNVRKVLSACGRAREGGANLVVFPEIVLPGYPPEDRLLRASFVAENPAPWRAGAASPPALPRVAGCAARAVAPRCGPGALVWGRALP